MWRNHVTSQHVPGHVTRHVTRLFSGEQFRWCVSRRRDTVRAGAQ